ncbi:MAG: MazG nucleotide pyrophosphohydrolase domain-containing protein [Candidatus Onthovivens sp.]|nr:MazG nucleotide pyrophosphohydrolase domain-containing protein [Candidatus Onthovivens sp.]
MENKLLTIFNTYGKSHQVSKLLEEVGEFIETVINEDKENMVQEMADCMVMLKQFQYYYGITDEEIINNMQFKIKRQLERIKEGK